MRSFGPHTTEDQQAAAVLPILSEILQDPRQGENSTIRTCDSCSLIQPENKEMQGGSSLGWCNQHTPNLLRNRNGWLPYHKEKLAVFEVFRYPTIHSCRCMHRNDEANSKNRPDHRTGLVEYSSVERLLQQHYLPLHCLCLAVQASFVFRCHRIM